MSRVIAHGVPLGDNHAMTPRDRARRQHPTTDRLGILGSPVPPPLGSGPSQGVIRRPAYSYHDTGATATALANYYTRAD